MISSGTRAILAAAISGALVGSGVGYFLWLWALKHTTPTKVAVFLSLSPGTATILGALILSETVTATFLFGLAAVAFGLIVAHRERS